jgi:hypothetical protein
LGQFLFFQVFIFVAYPLAMVEGENNTDYNVVERFVRVLSIPSIYGVLLAFTPDEEAWSIGALPWMLCIAIFFSGYTSFQKFVVGWTEYKAARDYQTHLGVRHTIVVNSTVTCTVMDNLDVFTDRDVCMFNGIQNILNACNFLAACLIEISVVWSWCPSPLPEP